MTSGDDPVTRSRAARATCNENMDAEDDEREERRKMFTESRERRRLKQKNDVALRIAAKCAEHINVIDEGGLLQMLGRLGNDPHMGFEQSLEDDKLFRCPVCFEQFEFVLSNMTEKRSSNLPVHSSVCSHKICCACLTGMQVANRALPKWLKCPICNQKTAFNAVEMPIDLFACGAMKRIESNTYVLSAAISLSDPSAKELSATKEKLLRAQRSIRRKSRELEAARKELKSMKAELARTQDLLPGGTTCNVKAASTKGHGNDAMGIDSDSVKATNNDGVISIGDSSDEEDEKDTKADEDETDTEEVLVWECDICRKEFSEEEDAIDHEKLCAGRQSATDGIATAESENTKSNVTTDRTKPIGVSASEPDEEDQQEEEWEDPRRPHGAVVQPKKKWNTKKRKTPNFGPPDEGSRKSKRPSNTKRCNATSVLEATLPVPW